MNGFIWIENDIIPKNSIVNIIGKYLEYGNLEVTFNSINYYIPSEYIIIIE